MGKLTICHEKAVKKIGDSEAKKLAAAQTNIAT